MITRIWRVNDAALWYTKLEHRLWSVVEVTFDVWPVASGHQAGVVWTVDRWKTANWTAATWEQNVPNPYGGYDERWKVSMNVGSTPFPVYFWYALYVDDSQGIRYWDNNQGWNYERIV